MDYTGILENLVGTSPFVAFLIWYILSERKVRQEDKIYNRKKQDEHDQAMKNLLMENQKVVLANTEIMKSLSQRYEELKGIVTQGFSDTNRDIKDLYKKVSGQ